MRLQRTRVEWYGGGLAYTCIYCDSKNAPPYCDDI